MTSPKDQLAHLIETSASAYAGFIVADFEEQFPLEFKSFGILLHENWRAYLQSRLIELASAVRAGQPRMFARHMDWCRTILVSRDIPDHVLRPAIQITLETLIAQLPEFTDLIRANVGAGLAVFDHPVSESRSALDINTTEGKLAARYVLAVLEGEGRAAGDLVMSAVRNGLDVRSAYEKVLIPAVREIGRMWHCNEVSIAEEHFVTAVTQRVLCQLQTLVEEMPPNGKTVIVSAVAGDRHEIGARMVADYFEMAGWRVIYLGVDMPSTDLATAVGDFQADVVVLAATLSTHVSSVAATISVIRATDLHVQPRVIVGGLVFTENESLADQVGADGCADSPAEAVRLGVVLTANSLD